MSCFWDVVVILSLLKFLQIPLFFKYLIKYLRQHNFSSYFIKMFRVRVVNVLRPNCALTFLVYPALVDCNILLPFPRVHQLPHNTNFCCIVESERWKSTQLVNRQELLGEDGQLWVHCNRLLDVIFFQFTFRSRSLVFHEIFILSLLSWEVHYLLLLRHLHIDSVCECHRGEDSNRRKWFSNQFDFLLY